VAAKTIDGFHLPGVDARAVAEWEELPVAGLSAVVRHPGATPSLVARVWEGLRDARRARGGIGAPPAALAAAAARTCELARGEPYRSAIARLARLSPPMVEHVLDGMLRGWSREALEDLLAAEFGGPAFPGAFAAVPGRPGVLRRAVAEDVVFHVFAANVPGVGVTAAIRTLLVGSAVFAKVGRGGSLLPALFGRALAETDPELGACYASTWWPGEDSAAGAVAEAAALERARLVVVYGGAAAVEAIRGRTAAGTRVVVHGPAVSVGILLREAVASRAVDETAAAAALAVATFDQRGCTSPVALLVEGSAETPVPAFGSALARELHRLALALPPGDAEPSEAARRRQVLEAALIRGETRGAGTGDAGPGGPGQARPSGPGARGPHEPQEGHGVAVVPSERLRPEDFCSGRVVQVVEVPSADKAVEALLPLAGRLQTVGVQGPRARVAALADRLADLGVSRITSLAGMAWPPADWRHDGSRPLDELVRWVDLECG